MRGLAPLVGAIINKADMSEQVFTLKVDGQNFPSVPTLVLAPLCNAKVAWTPVLVGRPRPGALVLDVEHQADQSQHVRGVQVAGESYKQAAIPVNVAANCSEVVGCGKPRREPFKYFCN